MTDTGQETRRRRRRGAETVEKPQRSTDYRVLKNPFTPHEALPPERIAGMHETALRVLEELGMRVLLPDARRRYREAGAIVDEDTMMVRIGRDIVTEALATAPSAFRLRAPSPRRDLPMETGTLTFKAGAGSPNCADLVEGRRPGRLKDFENFIRLSQSFDVIHALAPCVEAQDVPIQSRHYAMTRAQLALSDKTPFVYARGTAQVLDGFEMIRLAKGLSEEEFRAEPHCTTVINTNSPRVIDIPMAQGIIDFAEAGQMATITPFCLAGAMAPITVTGALVLQHAEALAGIVLAQITRPGAPVVYGSFSSGVDMRSGSPSFGTPEHVQSAMIAGQLARYIDLPWRAGGGSAAPCADAQAANETQMALWGSVMGGCTLLIHAAGWMEGGLVTSFEKFITDLEPLQTIAELCTPPASDDAALGFDAIAEVQPGGHFFSAAHTMERYRTAFYEPLVADWSNHGQWMASGGLTATERATSVWQQVLADFTPPPPLPGMDAVDAFIERREKEGGAQVVD